LPHIDENFPNRYPSVAVTSPQRPIVDHAESSLLHVEKSGEATYKTKCVSYLLLIGAVYE